MEIRAAGHYVEHVVFITNQLLKLKSSGQVKLSLSLKLFHFMNVFGKDF